MEYNQLLTTRARNVEPIEIRKVVDMIEGEDAIPLAAGWPNPETFPVDQLSSMVEQCLDDRGSDMLQYGMTSGWETLRRQIASRLESNFDMTVSPNEVFITSGSQQALYLVAKALLEDGDTAVVGSPTYVAALTAFESNANPDIVSVPLDEDGMDMDYLGELLNRTSPTLVYTVPTYQNPTGITMHESRRQRLVDLAQEHDFLIIEDTPYAELSYEADPPNPIASINRDRTIYLGTFSKVLAPGFRVGWLVAPPELIDTLELLRQPIDLHTNTVSQHLVSEFLQTDLINRRIERITEMYSDKRDLALSKLDETMPSYVDWTRPDGGMFLWMTLPERFDTDELLPKAVENGVAYIPGHAFYATEPRRNTLRINYTFVDDESVEQGIETLAETIRQWDRNVH